MTEDTGSLYDRSSHGWQRVEPVLLSDFTARPFLLDWCAPVPGRDVVDLGCGEGYVARALTRRGAGRVEGLDVSAEMIKSAKAREEREPLGIRYHVRDATDLKIFGDESFDIAVAVFLFNYLDRAQTRSTMRQAMRILRPGGRFIFSVPHPSLPFLRPETPPFYFSRGEAGYFSGRDKMFEGRIWRRDGESVPVRCVHKTLADYFRALRVAGFSRLPDVEELHVTEKHLALDPDFFGPLRDQPLHLAIRVEKTD